MFENICLNWYAVRMEYAQLHMDTYKIVQLLQTKGYSKDAAEGFIAAIQEITLSGVATKQDILELKNDTLKFLVIQSIALVGVMIGLFQIF